MDTSRPSFVIKPGDPGVARLILRNANLHRAINRALVEAGVVPTRNITIGYYRDDPVSFAPAQTAAALACLSLDLVRARICEDLVFRVQDAQDARAAERPAEPPR